MAVIESVRNWYKEQTTRVVKTETEIYDVEGSLLELVAGSDAAKNKAHSPKRASYAYELREVRMLGIPLGPWILAEDNPESCKRTG